MNLLKVALAGLLAFLAPVLASLRVIFSPAELSHAFVASIAASSVLGFAVTFLATVGTDAAANTSAGIVGAVVSFALLRISAQLAQLQAPKPPDVPPAPAPAPAPTPAKPTDPTGSMPPSPLMRVSYFDADFTKVREVIEGPRDVIPFDLGS